MTKKYTLKKAFQYLVKNKYRFKGRNINERSVRTLVENGVIPKSRCDCGISWVISKEDLDKEIEDKKMPDYD